MSKTFLFQAIQFTQTIQVSISILLVLFNPLIGPYQVLPLRAGVDLEQWQWRGTPHFPKLQHWWNFTIRLFSVISRTLVRGGLTPLQRCSQCILQPKLTGQSVHWGNQVAVGNYRVPCWLLMGDHMVGLVWFDLVLWHISHCRLFNAKSFLYIYIKYTISKHILLIT